MANGMPETIQETLLRVLDALNGETDVTKGDANGMPKDKEAILREIAAVLEAREQAPQSLADLADVEITDPQDGDVLVWSGEGSVWVNAQPAPSGTDTDIDTET